ASFSAQGTGNDMQDIVGATVRLARDTNGDGLFNGGESFLAAAQVSADDGVAVFEDLSLVINQNASDRLILVASFNGMASLGDTFQFTLDALEAEGANTARAAQSAGLPLAGPSLTVAPMIFDMLTP